MAGHSTVSIGARHPIHNWEFSNSTERESVTSFSSNDIGKIALELDTKTYWILSDLAPIEWKNITDSSSGSTPVIHQVDFNDNTTEDISIGDNNDRFLKIEYELETVVSNRVQSGTIQCVINTGSVYGGNKFNVSDESIVDQIEMDFVMISTVVYLRITSLNVGENLTIRYTVNKIQGV